FTEKALGLLSNIYLEQKNDQKAIPVLKRLETEADFPQNIIFAQSNLMKSYYQQEDYAQTIVYAERVLQNGKIENNVKSDAQVFIARSAIKTGDENRAKTAYQEVQKIAKGELAAEAQYYEAYFLNKEGKFKASNKSIQIIAKEYSGYKKYSYQGLLLMSKNFYDAEPPYKDPYQATVVLENIINSVKGYPEVVKEAEAELIRIKTEEAKTNSSVETQQN
ncbi:MAG: tetratricopeptide repeat protein, partial [Mesonia sp.]